MDATQKAQYERDQLRAELDEYKKAATFSEMGKTARSILTAQGINLSDDLV